MAKQVGPADLPKITESKMAKPRLKSQVSHGSSECSPGGRDEIMQVLPTGKALAVVIEPQSPTPWIADKKQGPAGETVSAFQAIT